MVEIDGLAKIAVGIDLRGKFATGIDDEGQTGLVIRRELVGVRAQVLGIDFQLVLEDVIAEFIAQCLRLSNVGLMDASACKART